MVRVADLNITVPRFVLMAIGAWKKDIGYSQCTLFSTMPSSPPSRPLASCAPLFRRAFCGRHGAPCCYKSVPVLWTDILFDPSVCHREIEPDTKCAALECRRVWASMHGLFGACRLQLHTHAAASSSRE